MALENNSYKNLVFLCGARDFHAMDWYRRSLDKLENINIFILTDLIEGEQFKCLIEENDVVFKLLILDNFLFRDQSNLGNYWRRFIKILVFPIQVYLIKKFSRKFPKSIFYAHGMYYIWLAKFSGIEYVGRPQGGDINIKPFKSKIYRLLSKKSIENAKAIIVDSQIMNNNIKKISNTDKVFVIPNGIDLKTIGELFKFKHKQNLRKAIISTRGFAKLYRIHEILASRKKREETSKLPIKFIYPFYDLDYKNSLEKFFIPTDEDISRLDKIDLYKEFMKAKLVISIPLSDSSPRSVYEAIFCGCIVAITYNSYFDNFPNSIKERVVLVDISQNDWFHYAINKADVLLKKPFDPCKKALNLFDQDQTFKEMANVIFN